MTAYKFSRQVTPARIVQLLGVVPSSPATMTIPPPNSGEPVEIDLPGVTLTGAQLTRLKLLMAALGFGEQET